MKSLISVIVPVYQAERYIAETLESLLNQTYDNFEVLLVDDCGNDRSIQIAKHYADSRFRFIRNPYNCGIAYSRNRGLECSRGELIAILDDDDVCMPYRFEKQVYFMKCYPEIDVVGGESIWIDNTGTMIRDRIAMPDNSDYIKTSFLFENVYNSSEVMFRSSLVENNGIRYKDGMLGMEDFRFWIDCSKVGKFSNLHEMLLKRRMTSDNATSQILEKRQKERSLLYRSLQEYSLRQSGFQLTECDLLSISCFVNERSNSLATKEELLDFYKVLRKIETEAEHLCFAEDNEQVKKYLKDRFMRCL